MPKQQIKKIKRSDAIVAIADSIKVRQDEYILRHEWSLMSLLMERHLEKAKEVLGRLDKLSRKAA